MSITWADLVVWVVIGLLAGSLAATIVTGKWAGLGRWSSLGVGLVGALIGGLIFSLFGIWAGSRCDCYLPKRYRSGVRWLIDLLAGSVAHKD